MKIITSLEVIKENFLKRDREREYIQNAINYIAQLETDIEVLKEQLEYQDEVINSLDSI